MKDRETARSWRMLPFVLACLFFPLIVSCATNSHISTRATRVRLVSAVDAHKVERDCDFLGNVTGFNQSTACLGGNLFQRIAYNNALNELLDNAAEIGATHVFVNLGDYSDLRGEAFSCAYCLAADGNPDMDFCQLADGSVDKAFCQSEDGKRMGEALCEGEEGAKDPQACAAAGGRWIPAIPQVVCEAQKGRWIPEARRPSECTARGGTWFPRARDQVTCEETKGGKWVVNPDVLRHVQEESGGGGRAK